VRELVVVCSARLIGFAKGLGQLYGEEGTTNVQGETQKKLDVIANEAFTSALRRSQVCSAMISEEDDTVIFIPEANGE
jgi:fructose-1,6-bisphosphatase I